MKYFLIAFFSFSALIASAVEEDDLGHFFNVNTITGHFEIDFCDIEIEGPIPFTLERSYTSSGALEANQDEVDLYLKEKRYSEWMFQDGWSLHSYLNLFIRYSSMGAYLQGKRGLIKFNLAKAKEFHDADSKHYNYLRTTQKNSKTSGNLSSRHKQRNDFLKVSKQGVKGRAVHYLADGTQRIYHGDPYAEESFWRLKKEILPSQHIVEYEYHSFYDSWRLKKVNIKNPSGNKTFTSISFDRDKYKDEKKLEISCSNGQRVSYFLLDNHKKRDYLSKTSDHLMVQSDYHYQPSRKGFGARLGAMSRVGKELFRVHYYVPESKKQKKKWAYEIKPKKYSDKVQILEIFDPLSEKFITFASFFYEKGRTRIVDYEGNETNYFHQDGQLTKVEYRGPNGKLQSIVELSWKEDNLTRKLRENGKGEPIYEKKFTYDQRGNVVREIWADHASSLPPVIKYITYTKSGLVETVREEGGLSYEFTYLPKTDLISRKLTYKNGKIIQREYFFYNEDHLLIATYLDDGKHPDIEHLEDATFRKIQKYFLNEETGMCAVAATYFYDFERNCDVFSKSESFAYNEKNQITRVDVQYEEGGPSYTTYLEYDERGNIVKKTSPLGRESAYTFDDRNLLKTSKEPGTSEKNFSYDHNGRQIACEKNGKILKSSYDLKGRLVKSTDLYGNETLQEFDSFGNCISTTLPTSLEEGGSLVISRAEMTYDTQGNIISHSDSLGNTTYTEYNSLRKPIRIVRPDQTETRNFYSQGGVLVKTINPDETEIHYAYDHLQRMTTKEIFSREGQPLSKEKWSYSNFHLLTYTDSNGLITRYTYNCKGQKIAEDTGGRITRYEYDPFGNIGAVIQGDWKKVQKHNVEGEVTELWEESQSGKVENHMAFFYDNEGRKEKAIRYTSKGQAEDHFCYDGEGRLILHIDPEGNQTEFQYREIENALGQKVLQKTRIDAIGNRTIETFDANYRLVSKEGQTPFGQTASFEETFYDPAGNRKKRLVTIYDDSLPIRTYTTAWEHDEIGRISEEIEEGEKVTSYSYDKMGKVATKTLPSGVTITYQYDGLGRVTETRSSDKSVYYTYKYTRGSYPTTAWDYVHNLKWEREYNLFDELISEARPDGMEMHWVFDDQGRIMKFLLPDKSSIQYSYQGKHLVQVSRLDPTGEEKYAHCYTSFDEWGHVETEEHLLSLGESFTDRDLLERVSRVSSPFHTASLTYGPSGLVDQIENSLFTTKAYTYDALNQLKSEGSTQYHFDSLGNPTKSAVNHFNQVTQDEKNCYAYDTNGNTCSATGSKTFVQYTYDALNRVIGIQTKTTDTKYLYDPFSRLYSKEKNEVQEGFFSTTHLSTKNTYLYDRESEIGTLDEAKNIRELKVLGLGLLGEIGASIALEIQGQVYAPLHDFNGNIIALVNAKGTIVEKMEPDAFGRCALKKTLINPWPFQSKRLEEGLIFFGLRFYNPVTGRFVSPDPLGSEGIANVYLFVLNSPLNRLDLFGLEDWDLHTETPLIHITEENTPSLLNVKVYFGELQGDWLVFSNQFHQLQYTAEELENGTFDILNHFGELIPKEGMETGSIPLVHGRNGIKNDRKDFEEFGRNLTAAFPEHILTIIEGTPTKGVVKDVNNTFRDKGRKETNEAMMCEQTMRAIMNTLGKINEDYKFVSVLHSRGGAISCAAVDRLEGEFKDKLKEKMVWFGLAPAEPILDNYCLESKSVYSHNDFVTGPLGRGFEVKQAWLPKGEKLYNIEFMQSNNMRNEHNFMSNTHQKALENFTRRVEREYGFVQPTR